MTDTYTHAPRGRIRPWYVLLSIACGTPTARAMALIVANCSTVATVSLLAVVYSTSLHVCMAFAWGVRFFTHLADAAAAC